MLSRVDKSHDDVPGKAVTERIKPVGLPGKLICGSGNLLWQPRTLMLRKRKGSGNIAFGRHDSVRKTQKTHSAKKEIIIYLADPALVLMDCLSWLYPVMLLASR